MRKRIAIVAAALFIGAVAFVVVDRVLGTNRLETWIGSVVVGIANSYLIPDISYEEIAYTAPGQVDLGAVALTAPDGTRIIEIDTLSLTLAEIPRAGKPLLIERVVIRDGTLNLIRDPETGDIKGLIPLLEPELTDEYEVESGSTTSEIKLSESLQLREIVLDNINLRFDDGSGTPLMLDGISITSEITPEEVDGQPGWYSLNIELSREGLELSVPGMVNLDTLVARVDDGSFTAQLDEQTIKSLPSALQKLLAQHGAAGSLDVTFNGMIPIMDPNTGLLTADVALHDFHATSGDYVFPIDSLIIEAGIAQGKLSVSKLTVNAIGGTINAQASIPLSEEKATASWTVDALDLAHLMSAQVKDNQRKLAGILSSTGQVEAHVKDLPESVGGAGTLKVRKGRLMRFPGLAELAAVMNVVTTGDGKPNHKVDAEFEFTPEGIHVIKSEVLTGFLAARGKGIIDYSANMDMAVNAGPLERLQSVLGSVGDIFGKITDQIMTYNVRGPIGDPVVTTSIGKRGAPRPDAPKTDAPDSEAPKNEGDG